MITFKYKDKIISTPNLEKKLKRMKLTLDDIEIMPDKPKTPESPKEYTSDGKVNKLYKHPNYDIIHSVWIKENTNPSLYEIFKNHIWNGTTGVKFMTKEYVLCLMKLN